MLSKKELAKQFLNENIAHSVTPDGKIFYKKKDVIKAMLFFYKFIKNQK
jgi:hypothetical protein